LESNRLPVMDPDGKEAELRSRGLSYLKAHAEMLQRRRVSASARIEEARLARPTALDAAEQDIEAELWSLSGVGGGARDVLHHLGLISGDESAAWRQRFLDSAGLAENEAEVRQRSEPRCSFCGRSEEEAGRLAAGPGVYICAPCVALQAEVLRNTDGG
jgi:predicted flap endonuclease-1-like 5' DNA nuclease